MAEPPIQQILAFAIPLRLPSLIYDIILSYVEIKEIAVLMYRWLMSNDEYVMCTSCGHDYGYSEVLSSFLITHQAAKDLAYENIHLDLGNSYNQNEKSRYIVNMIAK